MSLAALLAASFLSTGCIAPPPSRARIATGDRIFVHEPTRTFPHAQKWKPAFWFGNADEPMPPEDYRPDDPNRVRRWYWRNPGHNFDFYVVGIADKSFVRTGRHPSAVFNPAGGWNWACSHRGWCALPFASYLRGRFKFYLGWRERGNFGIKLAFARKEKAAVPHTVTGRRHTGSEAATRTSLDAQLGKP